LKEKQTNMKTLIYQYWYGATMEPCAKYGKQAMEAYANRIGAEYRFERDPTFFNGVCEQPVSFSCLMPVFNEDFHKYDAVVSVDLDIFPVDGLTENIFDTDFGEMNLCQEAHMPALKKQFGGSSRNRGLQAHNAWSKRMKDLYGVDMPKNNEGLYKIYNSGLVLYSKEGMRKAKEQFTPIQTFVNNFKPKFKPKLFWRDQAYIHAMFVVGGLDSRELNTGWNSQVHWMPKTVAKPGKHRPVVDCRNKDTKFVHVQLSGSGQWSYDRIWRVVNLPVEKWNLI